MSVVITKIQLADALGECALALSFAFPELVRAVNQNDPTIAIQRLTQLQTAMEQSASPFANLFIGALLAGFSENVSRTAKTDGQ